MRQFPEPKMILGVVVSSPSDFRTFGLILFTDIHRVDLAEVGVDTPIWIS